MSMVSLSGRVLLRTVVLIIFALGLVFAVLGSLHNFNRGVLNYEPAIGIGYMVLAVWLLSIDSHEIPFQRVRALQ